MTARRRRVSETSLKLWLWRTPLHRPIKHRRAALVGEIRFGSASQWKVQHVCMTGRRDNVNAPSAYFRRFQNRSASGRDLRVVRGTLRNIRSAPELILPFGENGRISCGWEQCASDWHRSRVICKSQKLRKNLHSSLRQTWKRPQVISNVRETTSGAHLYASVKNARCVECVPKID